MSVAEEFTNMLQPFLSVSKGKCNDQTRYSKGFTYFYFYCVLIHIVYMMCTCEETTTSALWVFCFTYMVV